MACLVYSLEVFRDRKEDTTPTICTLAEGEHRLHWFYLSERFVATESYYSFVHGSIPGYCGPREKAPPILTEILTNQKYAVDEFMTKWAITNLR